MKQIISRLLLTAAIVIVLIQSGAVNALFMLFVAGMVPGTDYIIPANMMMFGHCALICALLLYATARDLIRTLFMRHLHSTTDKHQSTPTQAVL